MGKRKPKPVRHELSGSKFLFLLRKNQSLLLPPLSFTFPLTEKSVFIQSLTFRVITQFGQQSGQHFARPFS